MTAFTIFHHAIIYLILKKKERKKNMGVKLSTPNAQQVKDPLTGTSAKLQLSDGWTYICLYITAKQRSLWSTQFHK